MEALEQEEVPVTRVLAPLLLAVFALLCAPLTGETGEGVGQSVSVEPLESAPIAAVGPTHDATSVKTAVAKAGAEPRPAPPGQHEDGFLASGGAPQPGSAWTQAAPSRTEPPAVGFQSGVRGRDPPTADLPPVA